MPQGLIVRHIFPTSVPPRLVAPLLRRLVAAGADEFTVTVMAMGEAQAPNADAFEDALAPWALPPATRRMPVDADGAPERSREVRRWALSEASLAALLPFLPGGLFAWVASPAGWLEDLTVYRGGELVLGIVTHEQEGILRLGADEHAAVAALGVGCRDVGEWVGY